MVNNNRKLDIDLLRIFGAIMVLGVHIGQLVGVDLNVGANGVYLLFILSGYLAFSSLDVDGNILKYYKNRMVRILPTYWTCLVILYVYDVIIGLCKKVSIRGLFGIQGQCGIRFLRYILGVQSILPSDDWNKWNNHSALWSMSSFLFFYLLAPFLFRLMNNVIRGGCVVIGCLLITPLINELAYKLLIQCDSVSEVELFTLMNPVSVLYCFVLGGYAYISTKYAVNNYYEFALLLFLLLPISNYRYEIIFTVLVIVAINYPIKVGSTKLIAEIVSAGKYTFSLYLLQPIVIDCYNNLMLQYIDSKIVNMIGASAFCCIAAYFVYDYMIIYLEKAVKLKLR